MSLINLRYRRGGRDADNTRRTAKSEVSRRTLRRHLAEHHNSSLSDLEKYMGGDATIIAFAIGDNFNVKVRVRSVCSLDAGKD